MKRFSSLLIASVLALAFALASCASPSNSAPSTTPAVAGYVKGVITALGSIWVNGVEYETTTANVVVDGVANKGEAALKVGMDVAFNAVNGVVTTVDYESEVKGFIGTIDTIAGSFTVFGQTVDVGLTTIFDGTGVTGLASLLAGDFVEVSGTVDPVSTHLVATRIEKKDSSQEDAKVKGLVSALAGNSFTLTTKDGVAFTVVATGTLAASIVNNALVRVEFIATEISGTTITVAADKIEAKHSEVKKHDGGEAEVEGVVEDYLLTGTTMTFTVDGQAVSAELALGTAAVAEGVRVKVKGTVSNGTLVAEELKVKPSDDDLDEGEGAVTGFDLANHTITILDASGDGAPVPLTLTVDATTIFDDDNWTGADPLSVVNNEFTLSGVTPYLVEVKYFDEVLETGTVHHLVKIESQN